jgi:asparagine synthase (glutamine-hydrolysing)
MCGLFASIGYAPDETRLDMIGHRGPDGRGWQVQDSPAGPVALGHRRLAIIDTSDHGLQPMADASGRFWLLFNGEIYNYVELREEMRARGEVFTTESDSEVLLRAVMLWQEGALDRLRGMFAFLVWDARDKRLFAARDRFGIKPLYVARGPSGIAFASEIKQLLGLPGVSGRMNVARVHDFLASGVLDHTEETLFEGVMQLRGGECLTVEAGGAQLESRRRRWYAAGAGHLKLSEAAAAARFRDLLTDAVRLHLRADVPVGSCLSGGLDSSAIVCLMAQMMGSAAGGPKVRTVSAAYAEKSVDETPFMKAVVAHAQTEPHFVYPKADDVLARASDITWHQDEPFGSTSIIAQWCVFETAKRVGVKVMLDGQGADEQLAGYHFAFPYALADRLRRGDLLGLLRTLRERRAHHGASIQRQLMMMAVPLSPPALAPLLRRLRSALSQHDWLDAGLIRARGNAEGASAVAARLLDLPPPRDIRSLCLNLTFASNLQMLLHWEDRNSMAHGIESRVPFLDHPLVEFSLALGGDHKMVGSDTKRVLRRAMTGILPESVRQRRDKLGFATPEESWMRGPLREPIRAAVEQALARYPDLFNVKGTRALVDEMLESRRAADFTLWRIASLGLWGERFKVTV